MSDQEISPSKHPIYRHETKDRPLQIAHGDEEAIALITQHVEQHIGPIYTIFHEIISDLVHIDIIVVAPTSERNYYTLVTCGMSNLPMAVPEGAEAFRYAELMLCLPPDWPMSEKAFHQEEHYWPIRSLKMLARLPHEYDTWLHVAHTIPNGNPATPYASNTKLIGMMLFVPETVKSFTEFFTLTFSPDKEVHFFSLIPLYAEEMDFKLKHGADALITKLEKAGVTEYIQLNRKNVCKKLFGLF
ncbi:suppressor of fused domain protein [Paenibacillus sp. MMS18-CY102]|uniref:suppressor of fused domain protein n=1 Tax=Paenibacillus sp. MMS18-CY102 TaxID=2682849 RepID=UPI00136540E6|nr:suppressor of fused domain protein [Paenibacillus sp. MMS18-CY102]MWC29640.1 suppressor of fused domain protein [Paenibacillus sp. MMS18-CY102]